MNDQLDATITIFLIFESAQHVSGNLLPIFRSVRLLLQQYGVLFNVVAGWRSRVRRCRLCVRCEWCCSTPHCCNHSLTLLKLSKIVPETCWADSKINKIVIVAFSWSFILLTYINDDVARSDTNKISIYVLIIIWRTLSLLISLRDSNFLESS
jgi:hypothetical protein